MDDIAHILALPEKERDDEIRKLIVPKPWKHRFQWPVEIVKPSEFPIWCYNCEGNIPYDVATFPCTAPNPIALDANRAMKMRDEYCNTPLHEIEFLAALEVVYIEAPDFTGFKRWIATKAQPHHYILAAWKAGEGE